MADASLRSKLNSGTGGHKGSDASLQEMLPKSGFPAELMGAPQFTEQAARLTLMGIEGFEAWLLASRRMIDLWRTTVREQQDAALAGWRGQAERSLAGEISTAAGGEASNVPGISATGQASTPASTRQVAPQAA